MHVRPPDLDDAQLASLLAQQWGFEAAQLRYAPVGYGSHHWVATARRGERRFVTVDVLAPGDREQRLRRLRASMLSAAALRDDGGLEFVVAPLRAAYGELVASLDDAFGAPCCPLSTAARGRTATVRPRPTASH